MPPFMSIQQAAAHLAVSPKTVRRWISDDRLTAHRVGARLIRIPTAELDRMMGAVGPGAY